MTNSEVIIASISKCLLGITIVIVGVLVGAFFGAIKAPFYIGVFDGSSKKTKSTIKDIINKTKDKL